MARVTPLLSSTSFFLMLSPIVLTLLVASWSTPAVEAKSLQAHDEPQWMQEIQKSPVDDEMPFEVRLRRSPQEPEQQPEGEKPGFFSSIWTSIKNFASMAFEAVSNFFGGIFGGSSSRRPDYDDSKTPRPPGDRTSPEPGEIGGGSFVYYDDNKITSTPTGKDSDETSTGPNHNGETLPTSSESQENSGVHIDDISPSDSVEGSIPVPSGIGIPSTDDGRSTVNYHGNGSSPFPNGGHETTSESIVLTAADIAENEILVA